MSLAEALAGLPDDARCYVPGVGEVTVLELVRARTEETPALVDPLEPTLAMWRHIALNPHVTVDEWLRSFGAGALESGESPASESTSDTKVLPFRSSGT